MKQIMVKLKTNHERFDSMKAIIKAESITDAVEKFYDRYESLMKKFHFEDDMIDDKFEFLIFE